MTTPSIRVVIFDDHPIVRDGLRQVLERRDDIEVVGEADNGREGVDVAIRTRPHVAIVDLDMPQLNGVATIRELARVLPAVRCIVLTLHDDDDHLYDALGAGACGFLVKGARSEQIERAVRAAADGQFVLGGDVESRVRAAMVAARPTPGEQAFPQLRPSDRELLDLVARGFDNLAIARRMNLASKTVRNRVSTLLTTLDVPDRAAAIRLARASGLGVERPD